MTTLSKQELIEFRKKLVRAKEFSKQTGWIFLFASLEKADLSWVTDCVVTVPKDFCVRGNTHGVRSGWFIWPINFDPVWLEECTLFETKP